MGSENVRSLSYPAAGTFFEQYEPSADAIEEKEAAMAKMNSAYAGVFLRNEFFSYLNDPNYNRAALLLQGDDFKQI